MAILRAEQHHTYHTRFTALFTHHNYPPHFEEVGAPHIKFHFQFSSVYEKPAYALFMIDAQLSSCYLVQFSPAVQFSRPLLHEHEVAVQLTTAVIGGWASS